MRSAVQVLRQPIGDRPVAHPAKPLGCRKARNNYVASSSFEAYFSAPSRQIKGEKRKKGPPAVASKSDKNNIMKWNGHLHTVLTQNSALIIARFQKLYPRPPASSPRSLKRTRSPSVSHSFSGTLRVASSPRPPNPSQNPQKRPLMRYPQTPPVPSHHPTIRTTGTSNFWWTQPPASRAANQCAGRAPSQDRDTTNQELADQKWQNAQALSLRQPQGIPTQAFL